MVGFENKIEVSFGTDLIEQVDKTLNNLKVHKLVLSVEKSNGVDCIKYIIEFENAEAAFLFGRTRPQINGM